MSKKISIELFREILGQRYLAKELMVRYSLSLRPWPLRHTHDYADLFTQ